MSIIVQKYGGTSVSTAEGRAIIAENAKQIVNANHQLVIVVSAMGRKGAPYATDTLIGLYNDILPEIASADLDLLLSCGETITASIVSNTLRKEGLKTRALNGFQAGIITDSIPGNASVIRVNTDRMLTLLNQGHIVIVTGFQGVTESMDITTLGRGGSDTTAAILGEALNADRIEIYTDVDGVMTADPRLYKDAKVLSEVSFEEVHQMALDGAKVVDPKAVAVAKRANKPIIVKNTFSKAVGTRIFNEMTVKTNKLVTAVAHKSDILQVKIKLNNEDVKFEGILKLMEATGISIDMINFLEDEKIFTIDQRFQTHLMGLLSELDLEAKLLEDCSKVTIVGHGIHGVPGVMKRMVLALTKAGVNILQTSDSHTTISCLIREKDLSKAIAALHDEYSLCEDNIG